MTAGSGEISSAGSIFLCSSHPTVTTGLFDKFTYPGRSDIVLVPAAQCAIIPYLSARFDPLRGHRLLDTSPANATQLERLA